MDYSKATNNQLWTILRSEIDCPLPLMEGAFLEALDRGLIRQYIKSTIKKIGISEETRYKLHADYEDLIQIGYMAALKAMEGYDSSKGTFINLLHIKIFQAYGMMFKASNVQKRKGEEISYHTEIDDASTLEIFLVDYRKNVEKTVIQKMELEEKLNRCKPTEREVFERYMLGYSLKEIAVQMESKKATVGKWLKTAIKKMAGYEIDLRKLGGYEQVTRKGA